MWKLFAELDPEAGAKVWTALDAHLECLKQRNGNAEVPLERLAADALVEVVTSSGVADGPRVPEVYVHIDWATLRDGLHDESHCELTNGTPMPIDAVRRLCCEAVIVPILHGPDGTPIDCGREIRTANRKQRRLLRAMYRTCAHPTCDVPFAYCHLHHVIPWLQMGRTDLGNLLPLCGRHHHLVHEGGWRLTMTADRTITLTRPDGVVQFTGRTTDRTPGARASPDERTAA
jgi:hypothetical protein